MHAAPLDRVGLSPQSNYRYCCWLVVGDKSQLVRVSEARSIDA